MKIILLSILGLFILVIVLPFTYIAYLSINTPMIINLEASEVSQCRSIGYGHRACGGYEKFLIYSAETTNEKRLQILVKQYNWIGKQVDSMIDGASICSIEPVPKLVLVNGKCGETYGP